MLENVKDLEKFTKKHLRMKQSKNIGKEADCSAPYDSQGPDMGTLWDPLGYL